MARPDCFDEHSCSAIRNYVAGLENEIYELKQIIKRGEDGTFTLAKQHQETCDKLDAIRRIVE